MRSRRVAIVYHVSCIMQRTHRQSRPAGLGCRDDGVRRSWHGDHRLRDDRRERIGQYCGWLENWSKRVRYRRYIGVKHHGRGRGKKTKVRHRQGSAFCLLAKRTRLETTARLTLLCVLSSTKKVACLPRETNEQTACTNSTNSRNRGPGPRASQPRRWRHPRTSGSRPPSICRPP